MRGYERGVRTVAGTSHTPIFSGFVSYHPGYRSGYNSSVPLYREISKASMGREYVSVHTWGKIPGSAGIPPAPERAILPAFPGNGPVLVNSYVSTASRLCHGPEGLRESPTPPFLVEVWRSFAASYTHRRSTMFGTPL
jgi:hypothetical protein